jgi:hypothetical protein
MATLITKNSSTAAAVPGTGDLVQGELAVNVADKRLFTKNSGGTVVEVGTNPSSLVVAGNVGVGVTPSAWGAGSKVVQFSSGAFAGAGISVLSVGNAYFDGTNYRYLANGFAAYHAVNNGAGQHAFFVAPSGTAGNAISFTQAMTLDSSGNLLVGTTTSLTNSANRLAVTGSQGIDAQSTGGATSQVGTLWNNAATGDNSFLQFGTEGTYTARGSIDYNRAGGLVRYNTTSDYRAKDILGPVANPGATIDALKVYEGRMKGATQSRPMLVAHEAQEHAPYAVSGVKDQVNEDGTPKFQQMDVSSLVPLLLAEIQSLRARVAALEQA